MSDDIPIYMHVNYLENSGLSFERACAMCADAGYDGIELRDRDRSGKLPLDEFLQHASRCAEQAGLQYTFGIRNDTTSAKSSDRQAAMAHFRTVARFAGSKGIKVVNFFTGLVLPEDQSHRSDRDNVGSRVANEAHWQRTIDYLHEACDFAADQNITLCMEMHRGYIHDLAAPTVQLVERVGRDNLKVNFDYGNIFLNPYAQSMAEELKTIAPYLGYVHVKNMAKFQDPFVRFATPLSDGHINHFVLVRKILETGYRGIITIENTMPGDKRLVMREDLTYLRSVLSDCIGLLDDAAQRPNDRALAR